MIFEEKPDAFAPRFEIASCYLTHDGEMALLHRLPEKSQGNKWGVPAGKLEPGESPLEAMVRELEEETGLRVEPGDISFNETVFVRYPTHDFVYHMFSLPVAERPAIRIKEDEHQAFTWATPEAALAMPLVEDLDLCIKKSFSL